MNELEFYNEIKNKSEQINLVLDQKMCEQFYKYMNLLLEWNEKINLTAITQQNEIILKHFIDSITINTYIKPEDKIADIGTGAGFPGIPIKIVNNNTQITLIDSLNKRIIFLEEVIKKLKLENITAIHSRVEEIAAKPEFREQFNIVTSRAVAKLNVLLEYMLPLAKIGGKCICMKGPQVEDELKEAEKAIKVLGGEVEKIEKIILPDSNLERNIVIIKKIKNTPQKYPRKAGTPSKQPIV